MNPLVKKGSPSLSAPPLKPAPTLGPKEVLPLWSSKGTSSKPEACGLCPMATKGSGFVPDWYGDQYEEPKLAFLLDFPAADDVLDQRPWSGRAGYAWEKKYLKPFGLSLSNVLISHVLRCQPKERKWGKPVYPTASLRRGAEITCRQHDGKCWGGPKLRAGGIKKYDPNLFVISFHPSDALLVPALSRLIHKDIEKAVKRQTEGYRPLVVMGVEAKELIAPWLRGGIKPWRGTFWEGSWPFKENSMLVEPGFLEA